MSDCFSAKTILNLVKLFFKLWKYFEDKITKFLFYKAYELSRVHHAFMNLDKAWKDLGPVQYLVHIDDAHNPISKNGNYIVIRAKNKDDKFFKVTICVTLDSEDIKFQQTVVAYNIEEKPTIISLDGLPKLKMYYSEENSLFYSEYKTIETSLHEVFKLNEPNQNLIQGILTSGKSYFTFYDILNSVSKTRWGEKWNVDLIKEEKTNIRNFYLGYCLNKKFLRTKNINLVQGLVYYLSYPKYFLYLFFSKDFVVNIIFWCQNVIKPRGLEKLLKEEEPEFSSQVRNKDLFFYHLCLLSR